MNFAIFAVPGNTLRSVEIDGLNWLGHHSMWTGRIEVIRHSERLYDLSIRGKHTRYKSPVGFSADFVPACLHVWWGTAEWTHVKGMDADDWSFVRDAGSDQHMIMFKQIMAEKQASIQERKSAGLPKPVRSRLRFQFRRDGYLMEPERFVRVTGKRGVTTTCKILSEKRLDLVATLVDTPEEIVARVTVVPYYFQSFLKKARANAASSIAQGDAYALSEYARALTMAADEAYLKHEKAKSKLAAQKKRA